MEAHLSTATGPSAPGSKIPRKAVRPGGDPSIPVPPPRPDPIGAYRAVLRARGITKERPLHRADMAMAARARDAVDTSQGWTGWTR